MANPPPPAYPYHMPQPPPQHVTDAEHLRLLSIFHYVLAGVHAIFGCLPLIHVFIGITMISKLSKIAVPSPPSGLPGPGATVSAGPPVEMMGWMFALMGIAAILCMQTGAILCFLNGRYLAARRKPMFCTVVAAIECLFAPLGTALGVFTIIVLQRPTVKALFEANRKPS